VASFTRILDLVNIVGGDCLLVALVALLIRKKVYRELAFLGAYIFFLVPREFVWLLISHSLYVRAPWAFYFYYVSDGILYSLRLLLIIEIAGRALRGYPAVWHFAWRILGLGGFMIVFWGTRSAIRHAHPKQQLVLTIQQYFNITEAVLLLLVLGIGLYYRIHVSNLYRLILTGICIYSAVQIVNSEFGRHIPVPAYSAFEFIGRYTFVIMIGIWTWAVWKWSPTPRTSPQLISQAEYDDLSPQVHDRLRDLNDRLAGLRKKSRGMRLHVE
jgi:hypothetical protein